jgi:hypothetical protein
VIGKLLISSTTPSHLSPLEMKPICDFPVYSLKTWLIIWMEIYKNRRSAATLTISPRQGRAVIYVTNSDLLALRLCRVTCDDRWRVPIAYKTGFSVSTCLTLKQKCNKTARFSFSIKNMVKYLFLNLKRFRKNGRIYPCLVCMAKYPLK